MTSELQLELITPTSVALSKQVESVVISGIEGDMEIFKDHIALITFLRPGKIIAKDIGGTNIFFSTGGVVELSNNKLNLLVQDLYQNSQFDSEELKKIKEDAEKKITSKDLSDRDAYLLNTTIEQINNLKS